MGSLLHDVVHALGIDLPTAFGIATGFLLAGALRGWRDVAVFVASAAVLLAPVKLIGDMFGPPGFADATFAWPFAPNGEFQFPLRPTSAVLCALFLSAIAMAVWKKLAPSPQPETETGDEEWTSRRNLSQAVLIILTPLLHLWTVFIVPAAGAEGLVATLLLPGLAQIYWIAALWPRTAALSHPMTLMSVVWLCAFIVWLGSTIVLRARSASTAARRDTAPRITFPPRPAVKRDAC